MNQGNDKDSAANNFEFLIRMNDIELSENEVARVRDAITSAAGGALAELNLQSSVREQELEQPQMVRTGWVTQGMVYRGEPPL